MCIREHTATIFSSFCLVNIVRTEPTGTLKLPELVP